MSKPVWTVELDAATHPNAMTFTGDGSVIVIVGGAWRGMLQDPEPGWAIAVDAKTGNLLGRLAGQRDGLSGVARIGGGGLVATGGYDGSLRIHDTAQMTPPQASAPIVDIGSIVAITASPDGRYLALGGLGEDQDDPVIVIWDCEQRRVALRRRIGEVAASLSFVPESGILLIGAFDGRIHALDIGSGLILYSIPPTADAPLARPATLSVSADGKMLAVLRTFPEPHATLGRVEIWDMASKRMRRLLPGDPNTHFQATSSSARRVKAATFSPQGSYLATVCEDKGRIAIWNLDGEPSHTALPTTPTGAEMVAFSPDGRFVAVASNRHVTLWNTASR